VPVPMRDRGRIVVESSSSSLLLRYRAGGADADEPGRFGLEHNYPNPFNPTTTIRFSVAENTRRVRLAVYDLLGREVAVLFDGSALAGRHTVAWDAGDAPAGVYYSRLESETGSATEKMLLIK